MLARDLSRAAEENRATAAELRAQLVAAAADLDIAADAAARCQADLHFAHFPGSGDIQEGTQGADGEELLGQLYELRQANLAAIEQANREISDKILKVETNDIPQLNEQLNFAQAELESNNSRLEELQRQIKAAQEVVSKQPISLSEYNRVVFMHTNK